jgi:hypothetical protein
MKKETIDLFIKREKLGIKIAKIIKELKIKQDKDVQVLDEYKEFVLVTNQLKKLC